MFWRVCLLSIGILFGLVITSSPESFEGLELCLSIFYLIGTVFGNANNEHISRKASPPPRCPGPVLPQLDRIAATTLSGIASTTDPMTCSIETESCVTDSELKWRKIIEISFCGVLICTFATCIATGIFARQVHNVNRLSFSPDGKWLAVGM